MKKEVIIGGSILAVIVIIMCLVIGTAPEGDFTRSEMREVKVSEYYDDYKSTVESYEDFYKDRSNDIITEFENERKDLKNTEEDYHQIDMLVEMKSDELSRLYNDSLRDIRNQVLMNKDNEVVYKYWKSKLKELYNEYGSTFEEHYEKYYFSGVEDE